MERWALIASLVDLSSPFSTASDVLGKIADKEQQLTTETTELQRTRGEMENDKEER